MGEVLNIQPDRPDLLFERVASRYAELLDERSGAPVRIEEALDATMDAHPEDYSHGKRDEYLSQLRTPEFQDYLKTRRQEHIVRTIAPRLVAAEMGSAMGSMAMEELVNRLERMPEDISEKSLLEIAKLGNELAAKVEPKEESEGSTQDSGESVFNQLIVSLPPEMAEGMAQDLIRRARMEQIEDG